MRKATVSILGIYLAACAGIGIARSAVPDSSRWTRYNGPAGRVVRIVVRTRCMAAEDSAAHLHLVNYGGGRAVYSCSRKGF